jgi:hypothetical protein
VICAICGKCVCAYILTLFLRRPFFDRKQTEAADALGVSTSTLTRVCKRLNIGRWPWRAAGKEEGQEEGQEVIEPASAPPLSTPRDPDSLGWINGWVVPKTSWLTPQRAVSQHQIDPIDLLLDSI